MHSKNKHSNCICAPREMQLTSDPNASMDHIELCWMPSTRDRANKDSRLNHHIFVCGCVNVADTDSLLCHPCWFCSLCLMLAQVMVVPLLGDRMVNVLFRLTVHVLHLLSLPFTENMFALCSVDVEVNLHCSDRIRCQVKHQSQFFSPAQWGRRMR